MSKYDPDAPPSYTEATTSPNAIPSSSASSSPPGLSSHLATLTSRLRSSHRSIDTHDINLVTLLIPDIEAHIEALRTPPRRGAPPRTAGQLTLVPAAAVPPAWHPSETPDRADELWHVARVRDVKGLLDTSSSEDGDAAPPTSSSREFDEWGRWEDEDGDRDGGGRSGAGRWWWRDEDLAARLARLLRPDARRGGTGSLGEEMRVTAEEVSFRRENEMGIWESMNGWGIVVRVTVRR